MWDVVAVVVSNCCCRLTSSFPAESRHPCLTLFSDMQLWWQVLEFPLKLPVPIVVHPTPTTPTPIPLHFLLSPLSLSFEALWDDDDTRRNRWMLSFLTWHTIEKNPSDPIQVSLLHSGTARPLTSGGGLSQENRGSQWGGALIDSPVEKAKTSSCSYLISAQQWGTFALLTSFFSPLLPNWIVFA